MSTSPSLNRSGVVGTKTWPFCSSVAPCQKWAVVMLLVVRHLPVEGLYSSAVARQGDWGLSIPIATSTSPSVNSVAVWFVRALAISPVIVHLPVAGSYNSALATTVPLELLPPTTRTRPFSSCVAVCPLRGTFRVPVFIQLPDACASTGKGSLPTSAIANNRARIRVGSATDPCTLIEIMTTSRSGIGCALVAPSTGFIRVFCEIIQESKELLGLADKESHIRQEFDHTLGNVFCFGRANNRAWRQISTDEGPWLRHD